MVSASNNGYQYTFLDDEKEYELQYTTLAMAELFGEIIWEPVPVVALLDKDGQLIVQTEEGLSSFDQEGEQTLLISHEQLSLSPGLDGTDLIWNIAMNDQDHMYLYLGEQLIILNEFREVIYQQNHDWIYPYFLPEGQLMARGSTYQYEDGSYTLLASPSGGEAGKGLTVSEEESLTLQRQNEITGAMQWSYTLMTAKERTSWDDTGFFVDEGENIYAVAYNGSLYSFDDSGHLQFKIASPHHTSNLLNVVPISETTFIVAINDTLLCFEYL